MRANARTSATERRALRDGLILLIVAALYYVSARLGLQLQFQGTQATPIWPPSGIAFAALIIFGSRLSGGVFLGALLANLADFYVKSNPGLGFAGAELLRHFSGHPEHVAISAAIALGNMLEALIGTHLVRRMVTGTDITTDIRSVLWFISAALLCSLVAATIGVSSLFAGSALPGPLVPATWFTWWLGDSTGILIIAPLALAWSRFGLAELNVRSPATLVRVAKAAIALLLLLLVSQFIFDGRLGPEASRLSARAFHGGLDFGAFAQAYLVIPFLLWIEFKFGNRAATLGVAVVAAVAVLATAAGRGPFSAHSQNEALLVLLGFNGVISITLLILDAALRERRQAVLALTRTRDELELRVAARTAELRRANDELMVRIEERGQALRRLEKETAKRLGAEAALRQAQKMEALGQLTGGIAHDFNNLLTAIFGSLEALRRRLKTEADSVRRPLDTALRAAARAATLTQRLLAFSRRQPLEPKPVNVNRLVAGMSDLMRRSLGEQVAVETALADGLWWCSVDANQLESALLNLAVNGRDAMPEGGKLTIETGNAHLDEAYAASHEGVAPGPYVMIAVTDTGIGMTAETIAKAFEPFFTTKDAGHGTGLGLSQVYGFVKQSGGHVTIDSEPGAGATARIYLPRLAEAAGRDEGAAAERAPADASGEIILVVEDDQDVRAHSSGLLRELGYRVVEAADSGAALRLLEEKPEIDLLFADLGLPGGLDGRRLADRARGRKPGLKVLFTTGYGRNAIIRQGRHDPGIEFIMKPFTFATLAAKIRLTLER